jgi:hypothetical protein
MQSNHQSSALLSKPLAYQQRVDHLLTNWCMNAELSTARVDFMHSHSFFLVLCKYLGLDPSGEQIEAHA